MANSYYDEMISVVVLSYNTSLSRIYYTLESIMKQKDARYEIIVADDGSEIQFFKEIEDYFKKYNFCDYVIIKTKENVGTVKNFLRALFYAKGKYIKGLGAGDCLYNSYVLKEIVNFQTEHQVCIGFGKLQAFMPKKTGGFENIDWTAPKDVFPYVKHREELIRKNMIIYEDYISGASIFFEKKYFMDKLKQLEPTVKYCEDLIQIIAVLDNEKIAYLDKNIVYYELGEGISTKKENGLINPRMQIDHKCFNDYLVQNYLGYEISKRVKRKNRIEKNFIFKIYYGVKNLSFYLRKAYALHRIGKEKVDFSFLEMIEKILRDKNEENMESKLYTFQIHGDNRGQLIAIEELKDIPFEVKRIYYMYDTKDGVRRGYHAHRQLEQILICIHGSCKIHLDDGEEKKEILLNNPSEGLFIANDIWREMYDFSSDAVLLVLASENYDENDYIRNYDEFIDFVNYKR